MNPIASRTSEVEVTVPWETGVVAERPSYIAPSGKTEIRLLPSLPSGELTHATLPAGQVSTAAVVDGVTEAFYVLEGEGAIWRADGDGEEVVGLHPGRAALIPPHVAFQYRAGGDAQLVFIVAVMPRWTPENWHASDVSYWDERGEPTHALPQPPASPAWQTKDVPAEPDHIAPDGSEIRVLPECEAGGLAHCRLPAGSTTKPVRHRTVDEVWYVLDGSGDIWRSNGSAEVVRLETGTCVTIPCGTSFQFRSDAEAPLSLLLGTFPRWPGPEEAVEVQGSWDPSV
jgi:mannose-6-phosphate isomerase-like protein (cupin superfamily)